jgi:Fe-S-cluster containining protein
MSGKQSPRDQKAAAALDALYAELPSIQCRGKCAEACGSIVTTDLEARRAHQAAHRKPKTIPLADDHQRCVYLSDTGRCTVYAVRPFVCRLYGLVKLLSCPWGCVPDRWVTTRDALAIALRIEQIAGGRILRTSPEGLTATPGDTWRSLLPAGRVLRSEQAMEEDSERTRTLRAIHGGRIMIALDTTRE